MCLESDLVKGIVRLQSDMLLIRTIQDLRLYERLFRGRVSCKQSVVCKNTIMKAGTGSAQERNQDRGKKKDTAEKGRY